MKFVTSEEMRALDRKTAEEYGISSLILMENAGRGCADLLSALLRKENLTVKKIHILCGKGNNGGDGFVLARHLWNREYEVSCWLTGNPQELSPESRVNFEILQKMTIPAVSKDFDAWISEADLIVDALFGIGLSRPLSGDLLILIQKLNKSGKKIFSIDIPSGMDADTGKGLPESIKASWTATLGLPKKGFSFDHAALFLGELFILDIGFPRELLDGKPNP
ncbi:MAG: NAD(P)H-hydrate epimerase [Candidatus Omnitrophica bacterium]|nr:NAD(P)H-hydrate epimerase [Candidatus Omnitrophota bacterium]